MTACVYTKTKYEPQHDKTNKMSVVPAKTQISLGFRPVWSVFAVRMKKPWVLSYPMSAQRRLWSDWADAQADLSVRWAHTRFVVFVMSLLIYFPPLFKLSLMQNSLYICIWTLYSFTYHHISVCFFNLIFPFSFGNIVFKSPANEDMNWKAIDFETKLSRLNKILWAKSQIIFGMYDFQFESI